MTSHTDNMEMMSSDTIPTIVTPGVSATVAKMSAAAMTSAENISQEEILPPYMQNRFLGALATWKTVEPLDNNNWIAWKGQIMPMLQLNGVWGHCIGTDLCPIDNPHKAGQWDMVEMVAKMMISVNIQPLQFVHIAQAIMVHEIWENLMSVHEIRGQQTITAQWHTLYCTTTVEGNDIDEHLLRLRSLQTELHQMGMMVTDREFKNLVTTSMLALWNPWLSTYSQQHADATSQTMINMMKDEWCRCQGMPAAEK